MMPMNCFIFRAPAIIAFPFQKVCFVKQMSYCLASGEVTVLAGSEGACEFSHERRRECIENEEEVVLHPARSGIIVVEFHVFLGGEQDG